MEGNLPPAHPDVETSWEGKVWEKQKGHCRPGGQREGGEAGHGERQTDIVRDTRRALLFGILFSVLFPVHVWGFLRSRLLLLCCNPTPSPLSRKATRCSNNVRIRNIRFNKDKVFYFPIESDTKERKIPRHEEITDGDEVLERMDGEGGEDDGVRSFEAERTECGFSWRARYWGSSGGCRCQVLGLFILFFEGGVSIVPTLSLSS
ncbi:hypothetical protein BDP67DRAFT_46394 [Colletotrichum lupini]|nr:hypothetical protein BDP67DRAFT_46394 [Colletotrichum lupini]